MVFTGNTRNTLGGFCKPIDGFYSNNHCINRRMAGTNKATSAGMISHPHPMNAKGVIP